MKHFSNKCFLRNIFLESIYRDFPVKYHLFLGKKMRFRDVCKKFAQILSSRDNFRLSSPHSLSSNPQKKEFVMFIKPIEENQTYA